MERIKAASHSILSLDCALIEKLERIAAFRLQTSGGSELTIDCVEETLDALGRRSAARWVFELLHRRGVVTTLSKELFVSTLATAINSSSAANRSFYFRQARVANSAPGDLHRSRCKNGHACFACSWLSLRRLLLIKHLCVIGLMHETHPKTNPST